MASIVEKNPRRFRVQFSMSRSLHSDYWQCMQLAEELKVSIDFTKDFERWFSAQLEQVTRELGKMKRQHEGDQGADQSLAEHGKKQPNAAAIGVKAPSSLPRGEGESIAIGQTSGDIFSDSEEIVVSCSNEEGAYGDDSE